MKYGFVIISFFSFSFVPLSIFSNSIYNFYCCCSVTKSCLTLCDPMNCSMPGFPVLHYLLERAQTHVHCLWCHATISSSVAPSPSCPQSVPASDSFTMIFASGGQNTGASASISVFPVSIQDWFPLGLTGLISLLSKGLEPLISFPHFSSNLYNNLYNFYKWVLINPI